MTFLVRGMIERGIRKLGHRVAGVDEVGKGCLAGPVFAACVILNYKDLARIKKPTRGLIRDSKTLSAAQRQNLLPFLYDVAEQWSLGMADVREIEQFGIQRATFLAMKRCLSVCSQSIDYVLVDGNQLIKDISVPQKAVVKGDNRCFAIAAASIMAKEARDSFMRNQAMIYPDYGFETHVGYGTKQHLCQIKNLGITPLHRRNFAPISQFV